MLTAHFYPSTADEITGQSETVEIHTDDADVIADDVEVRDHPEVTLTDAQRDAVLARMHFRRVGAWVAQPDGRANAPVEPVSPLRTA
ncbi:hypothetical protein ABTX81_30680 [Kitasatospora sp. NPDC097605]|uniref:hypothetical protein n=1 Tax=Kitasatospora sp. NPDC097605 TaxID=3157226 RepID=UPI00332F25FA